MTTSNGNGLLTVDKMRPGDEESEQDRNRVQQHTYQAELETLLAVSTLPPKMTSFMPTSPQHIREWWCECPKDA